METQNPVPGFYQPTRPYSVIDAINRMAAATGSPRYAMAASNANYNGHHVRVYFNSYRRYWLAEYSWSGRNVLMRGSLGECLEAAKREYARGALGSSTSADYPNARFATGEPPPESPEEFARVCREAGLVCEADEPREACDAKWRGPLYDKVCDAMRYEQHGIAPAVGFLANSKTVEEYEAKIDAFCKERQARMAAR